MERVDVLSLVNNIQKPPCTIHINPGGVTKKTDNEGLNGGLILQPPVGIYPNQAHGTSS